MQRQDQTCGCSMMPVQKNSRSTYFFCLPQKKKYLQSSLKGHRGQTQLVPRLHIKMYQVKISNQT